MRKADIEYHLLGSGYDSVPAVNVKTDTWQWWKHAEEVALDNGDSPENAARFAAWLKETAEGDDAYLELEWTWEAACRNGWDMLEEDAREIWGRQVKVYSEGRSGGWAYVDSIDRESVEGWDAIDLGRWERFCRYARAYADDIPRQMCWLAYVNTWEQMEAERVEAEEAAEEIALARY